MRTYEGTSWLLGAVVCLGGFVFWGCGSRGGQVRQPPPGPQALTAEDYLARCQKYAAQRSSTKRAVMAIEACREALTRRPSLHRAALLLSQIYERQGEWQAAARSLRRYRKATPFSRKLALRQVRLDAKCGAYERATRLMAGLLRRFPKEYGLQVKQLVLFRKSKRFAQAELLARRLLARLPKDAMVYRSMILLYHDWGKYNQAVLVGNVALQSIAPGDAEIHNNLGNVYLKKNNTLRAIHHFREAIRHQPHHKEARLNLGTIFLSQGNWRLAHRHFAVVIKHHPKHLYGLRGAGVGLMGLRKLAKAKQIYARILALAPGDPEAHFQLGVIAFSSRDIKRKRASMEHFERFLRHANARKMPQFERAARFIKAARARLKTLSALRDRPRPAPASRRPLAPPPLRLQKPRPRP